MKTFQFPAIVFCGLLLAACSSSKIVRKPLPLANIKHEVTFKKEWSTDVGAGTWDRYLRLTPAYYSNTFYTTDKNGKVKAIDATNGRVKWSKNLRVPFVSDVGVSKHYLMLGTANAELIVLDRIKGTILWRAELSNELVSRPIYHRGKIFIKTVDSVITAFDSNTGKIIWRNKEDAPSLTQRVGSAIIARGDRVFVGLANGNLMVFSTYDGQISWKKLLTNNRNYGLENMMVDVDIDPKIYNNNLYVAGINSNVVSIDISSYSINWKKQVSTYSGLDVDRAAVVLTDNDGIVYLYRRTSGRLVWRQEGLKYRGLTSPTIYKGYIFVADEQGYLHVLSESSGRLIGRVYVHKTGVIVPPMVQNGKVCVKANNGDLIAYSF